MYYLRFTKVIINHFMSQDQSIPRRNKVDWHIANDDPILTIIRFIPLHEVVQKYGAILPDSLTNQAMKESEAYKTYMILLLERWLQNQSMYGDPPGRRLNMLLKLPQVKDSKLRSADEGIGVSLGVLDIPTYESEDENISWKSSEENDDEEVSINLRVQTPSYYESTNDEESGEETQGANVEGEELDEEETNEDDEGNELYREVNKYVEYVYLLWEDLVYQVENKVSKKNKDMYYPRFTKVIINHFMSQDQSIPRRNKVDWHIANDEPILATMRFIPQHEVVQKYDAILPDSLTNQAMKESEAYKTYYDLATGKVAPKPKYVWRSTREKTKHASKASSGKRLKATAKMTKSGKKKQPAEGLETLSEIALTEAAQMKIVTKISKTQFHSSHISGSGADEGTGVSPGVLDVPTYGSEDELISWKSSEEDNDEEVSISKDDDDNDVNEKTESDNDGDDFVHPKFSTHDQEERQNEEDIQEESSYIRVQTPSHYESTDDEDSEVEIQGANVEGEELDEEETNEDDEGNELYREVNVLTIAESPLSFTTNTFLPHIPLITHLQQTPVPTPTIVPSSYLQDLPNFGSLFGFDHRLKTLENDFLEFKQTNQFAASVSSIPGIVDTYLANKMNEAVKIAVQLQSNRLRDEAQAENEDFINKLDDNINKIIKEQVKEQVKAQVSKILPKIEKTVNEQLEAEVLTRSSNEFKTSHAVATNLSELELKKILIDKMETNKYCLIQKTSSDEDKDEKPSTGSNLGWWSKRTKSWKETRSQPVAPKEKRSSKTIGKFTEGSKSYHESADKSAQAEESMHTSKDLEEPAHQEFITRHKPPTPDRDWNKTLLAAHGPVQPWLSTLAQKEDTRDSFNELMDTPLDFSAFVMNRLKVDTLTPELLAGPTFELMKGSCKSLPLPLIPNSRCRQVIPFDHFINNDLAYLSGGASSRTYTTLVTKTKAADYGHIKWIEDLVPNKMESTHDVYSRHRIIAVRKLQIVEWHNYKHLDWIIVRRNDDKLYKFKEGDYKRLRLQDIEDMLLLLVQGKLTNLTIEE
ncbi:hypothetical protein Tco_0299219 [Tanacetum coccineum]